MAIVLWLLAVDASLIAVHAALSLAGSPLRDWFSISQERAVPEWWQYAKFAFAVIAMIGLARAWEARSLYAWALLFAFFLVDDSLGAHEAGGTVLSAALGGAHPFAQSGQAIGELLFVGIVAAIFFPALFHIWRHGTGAARRLSATLFGLVGMLAFFGVAVDFLRAGFDYAEFGGRMMTVAEDGGEMVSVSLMVAYLAHQFRPEGSREERAGIAVALFRRVLRRVPA